ncbi:GNAT family N-acetyltransferase [uncultured Polaribacter sp.]|uniref:GNAT family N-acetyltransferase n=1 Tax=uncultured Polaribacter sp. TaxID=174711 RepID=UPI00260AAB0D|nr:GNAT family N-acetyltransferase [uncultured Polaribacter sp.]
MIIRATVPNAKELTEIALKSKSYWGYSDELIESWREDLTITTKMFEDFDVYIFQINTEIAGFYILNRTNITTSFLEFLFVLPKYIKQGIGKQLLAHAIAYCIDSGSKVLNVLSDPNAQAFYAKHGFKVVAKKESSIKDRFLPEMELKFLENR